jgi:hypothetical protein
MVARKALAKHVHHGHIVDMGDSDFIKSGRTAPLYAEVSVEQRQQQEKRIIPPSISKPAKRKSVDVGGKMYEDDELMILNLRLKQYGYESTIALLRDFKDGIFPEDCFKPQGALHMDQN